MSLGKKLRLSRIVPPRRRSIVIAFDHALALGPIPGMEKPREQVRRFANAGADAVLMSPGGMRLCGDALADGARTSAILRVDWTNLWTSDGGQRLRSELLARPEAALAMGADAVLSYLILGTGDSEFEAREIVRNAELADECSRVGIPLIVESLARGEAIPNPRNVTQLMYHTRIAVEIGADAIKTEFTGDPTSMREVIQACPIPLLVLGGVRLESDEQALELIREIASSEPAGIFFGRNVFQAENVEKVIAGAKSILNGVPELTPAVA